MAHRLVAVAMILAALLVAAHVYAQEAQEEPPDLPGLYATVLKAVKAEMPDKRLVLSIRRGGGRTEPVTRLPASQVRAVRDRTAIVDAVCDPIPEGRREQPCNTPGLREGAFLVSLGPVGMQPNGEVMVSVQITVPQVEGPSEISGMTYVLKRERGAWIVDRIANRWMM